METTREKLEESWEREAVIRDNSLRALHEKLDNLNIPDVLQDYILLVVDCHFSVLKHWKCSTR